MASQHVTLEGDVLVRKRQSLRNNLYNSSTRLLNHSNESTITIPHSNVDLSL